MTVETSEMLKYLLWIVLAIAILVLIKWACNKSDKLVEGLKSKSSDEDDEDANEKKINKIKKKSKSKNFDPNQLELTLNNGGGQ